MTEGARTPRRLEFRDVAQGKALRARLEHATRRAAREVSLMHVCGSHEQAMARYGMRASFPRALRVQMGPGCPVCVTDAPEIDACIALAAKGVRVLTYGDMLRVPGRAMSLDDARAAGARVDVVYGPAQVAQIARASKEPVLFFATGFETTAVATAALLMDDPPDNLAVLSAHKWVPAAMEVVAQTPDSKIEGFLAAGHAASITGYGIFESFVERHRVPVVVGGFEPLDVLSALVLLVELVVEGRHEVVNAFPRCVSREGNRRALAAMRAVFELGDGDWRGIAHVPGGNLVLRPAFARWDARTRFGVELASAPRVEERADASECRCGKIMSGLAQPDDCPHFGKACRPDAPIGACMVSTEGACRIWFEHGLGGAG